jgi:Fe-S cluster biogenesis protein NfuA
MADLADEAVEDRLARLDGMLAELAEDGGPLARLALEAVAMLTEVYGTALSRALRITGDAGTVAVAVEKDDLLAHLLVLHGLHPLSVTERVERALADVRPYVRSHGGEVKLVGITDAGVARVRFSGTCSTCASSTATLERVIRDAVLVAAPELSRVEAESAPVEHPRTSGNSGARGRRGDPALIPVEALLRRTPTAGAVAGHPGRPSGPGSAPGGAGTVARAGAPRGTTAADPVETCDLCGQRLPGNHRHMLDTASGELICACQACCILFDRDQASDGHYRLIPPQRRPLPALVPASLGVPVGLAFFVRHTDGSVAAHYPSPAGATRWQVDEDRWREAVRASPEIGDLAPDVQAVLVNTAGGRAQAWLVPIDDCYRLVAVVREGWEGLTGGDRVWPEIERFFAGLSSSVT